jgi:hypothetical protein
VTVCGRDPGPRKPLLEGRGIIRIEDFCDVSGLGRDTVEDLMRRGFFGGGLWRDEERTRAMGMFEDLLPSRERLIALGLRAREGYHPPRQ